jgi:hypothetical protein
VYHILNGDALQERFPQEIMGEKIITRECLMDANLKGKYPFIPAAVEAHIARIPTENSPGRPRQTLLDIMKELETDEFGPVFREFCKLESIYGLADLQVKRLLKEIKNDA